MYNFCITDLKTGKSRFYVWDEVTGGRGSIEILSCLDKWIGIEYARKDFTTLIVFSDNNCGSQNKSVNNILFYLRELHSSRLQRIDHYYLIPGHNYMACDRAFGVIEKNIRSEGIIYNFEGYCNAIKHATKVQNEVIMMNRQEFKEFDKLRDYITHRKPREPYSFINSRHFAFTPNFMEGYLLGMDYDSPLGTVHFMPGTGKYSSSKFNKHNIHLKPKYQKPRQMKASKLKHLKELQSFIPAPEDDYFKEVFKSQMEPVAVTDVGDDDDHDDDILEYDSDDSSGESSQ